MLTFLATFAHAQTFTVEAESVLDRPLLFPNGVGAPSVAHDPATGRYTMYVETRIAPPAGCDEAWAIHRAVSTDGLDFTPLPGRIGPQPIAPCGVRHPSIVLHDDGSRALFFQVLDETSSDGVGVLTTVNGALEVRVLEDLRGLLEPTAARLDGEWAVMGIDASGLVVARSTDLVSFTFDPAPEIANSAIPWTTDGLAMPALGCIDGTSYPWELYFGGWSGTQSGWAWAVSSTAGAWYVTAPFALWTDDSAWTSVDFVTDGAATRVWFETIGEDGLPRIGSAIEGGALDATSLRDRDCQL